MKSLGKICEEFAGWMVFLIGFALSCLVNPESYNYSKLISEFPAIGLGIFGFMLTFIAIILQANNDTINYMKSNAILFQDFVDYNKRVVYLSAILTFYAYFLPHFHITFQWSILGIPIHEYVKIVVISLFWGLLGKLCVDSYFFLRLFFILLKKIDYSLDILVSCQKVTSFLWTKHELPWMYKKYQPLCI